jgi:hypothetical protein
MPFVAEGMSPAALAAIEALEAGWGQPLTRTSGYRDPEYNARVGGAKHSEHTRGNAVDYDVSHLSPEQQGELIRQAKAIGLKGVGIYNGSLHFDIGPERAWGPSYHSDSIPDWARQYVGLPAGPLPGGSAGLSFGPGVPAGAGLSGMLPGGPAGLSLGELEEQRTQDAEEDTTMALLSAGRQLLGV